MAPITLYLHNTLKFFEGKDGFLHRSREYLCLFETAAVCWDLQNIVPFRVAVPFGFWIHLEFCSHIYFIFFVFFLPSFRRVCFGKGFGALSAMQKKISSANYNFWNKKNSFESIFLLLQFSSFTGFCRAEILAMHAGHQNSLFKLSKSTIQTIFQIFHLLWFWTS